jgi:hypothetical protein
MMPGWADGLELAAFVRHQRPSVKVAVMSGNYVPNWEEDRLFDCFFSKPLPGGYARTLGELVSGTASASQRSSSYDASEPKTRHNFGSGR